MYISTRDNYPPVSVSEAIRLGMVPAGGLFVPAEIPVLSREEIYTQRGNSYPDVYKRQVLSLSSSCEMSCSLFLCPIFSPACIISKLVDSSRKFRLFSA